MKNGDTRSAAWIARALKEYTRDDEGVQTSLMLVGDIEPTPSLDEIRTWSVEQCLLATDWAWCVHASASDNNNRVPGCPDFLTSYRRAYPARTNTQAARALVQAMSDDNGCCFHPTARQLARLEVGVALMQKAGCFFTDAEIQLLGAGEATEVENHFKRFAGFDVVNPTLGNIFEELDDDGNVKDAAAGEADRKRHHHQPEG